MIHIWVTQMIGDRIRVTPPYGIRQTTVPIPEVEDPHKAVLMRRIFNSYSKDEKVTVEKREEVVPDGEHPRRVTGYVWRVIVEPAGREERYTSQVSKNYIAIYACPAKGMVVGIGSAIRGVESGLWAAMLFGTDGPYTLAEVPTSNEAVDIVWEARHRARHIDGKLRLRKPKAA